MARAIAHVVSSYREDDAHNSNDAGLMLLAVRKDTALALAGTDGDFIPLIVDASGRLHVVTSGTGAGGTVDTELPAAATLTSAGFANQAAPQVVAQVGGLSGTTIFPVAILANNADAIGGIGLIVSGFNHLSNGATWDRARTPKVFTTVDLAAATAETTIWDPAAGKKFRLMGGWLTASAQTKLTFKDNTGGTTILILELGANTPFNLAGMGNGILSAAADNVLTVTRSVSATLAGVVFGTEE